MLKSRTSRSRRGIAPILIVAIIGFALVAALLIALLVQGLFAGDLNVTVNNMTENMQGGPAGPTSDVTPSDAPLAPTDNTTTSAPDLVEPAPIPDVTTDNDGQDGADGSDGADGADGEDPIPTPPADGGYTFNDNDSITQIFIVDGAGARTEITELLRERGIDPAAFQAILERVGRADANSTDPVSREELESSGELQTLSQADDAAGPADASPADAANATDGSAAGAADTTAADASAAADTASSNPAEATL